MSKKWLIVFGLLLVVFCGCGGGACGVLAPVSEMSSQAHEDFRHQCDIALGADPSATRTTTAEATTSSVAPSTSAQPTANPYASLTIAADDPDYTNRDRACATAMQVAPWQGSVLAEPNTGPVAQCAADLALRYPEAGGTAQTARYLRDVTFSASAASSSGACAVRRAPPAESAADCGTPDEQAGPVLLPQRVPVQGYCGMTVDPDAVSPGDLVFWDYGADGATRAGIALGTDEMVTVESGEFVRSRLPDTSDLQIKRVLEDGR